MLNRKENKRVDMICRILTIILIPIVIYVTIQSCNIEKNRDVKIENVLCDLYINGSIEDENQIIMYLNYYNVQLKCNY